MKLGSVSAGAVLPDELLAFAAGTARVAAARLVAAGIGGGAISANLTFGFAACFVATKACLSIDSVSSSSANVPPCVLPKYDLRFRLSLAVRCF